MTKYTGDNDPIDICATGSKIRARDEIIWVKMLSKLAMINKGEAKWEVTAICVDGADVVNYNGINNVEWLKPSHLEATEGWFRRCKFPDGKPENRFIFNAEF